MASSASTRTSSHPDAHLYIPFERIPLELHHHRTTSIVNVTSTDHVNNETLHMNKSTKSNRVLQFLHKRKTSLLQRSKNRLLRIYGWLDDIDTTPSSVPKRSLSKRMTHKRSISAPLHPSNTFVTVTLEGGMGRWAVLSSTEGSQSIHEASTAVLQQSHGLEERVEGPFELEANEPTPLRATASSPQNVLDPEVPFPPTPRAAAPLSPFLPFPPWPMTSSAVPQDPETSSRVTLWMSLLAKVEAGIRSRGPYTFKPPTLSPRPATHPDHALPLPTQLHLSLKAASQAHAWACRRLAEGVDPFSLQPFTCVLVLDCLELIKLSTALLWDTIDSGPLGLADLGYGILGLMASFHGVASGGLPAGVSARMERVRKGLRAMEPMTAFQRAFADEGVWEWGRKEVHMGSTLLVQWLRDGGIEGVGWGFVVLVVQRWVKKLGLERGLHWDVVAAVVEVPAGG